MDAIFLNDTRGYIGEDSVAKKWNQVHPDPHFLSRNVVAVALPLRDYFVFREEAFGGLAKCLSAFDLAGPRFSAEFEIPVLGKLLRALEAIFARAYASILSSKERRALPVPTIRPSVNVNFASHD